MLTVSEAEQIILNNLPQWGLKTVGVHDALGCILQQKIIASRPQPPFDRVTMDGIAIAFADYKRGQRCFPLQGVQLAGQSEKTLKLGHCLQVTTGAAVPRGADCIIPIEQTVMNGRDVTVTTNNLKERQFIHPRGSDYPKGHTLLTPGTKISASELGCVLSSGATHINVAHDPHIGIIITGNEIVKVGADIKKHQIYATNDTVLSALLKQNGFSNIECKHAIDSVKVMSNLFSEALQEVDVLIITGGVSMGKADLVPFVLNQLGVEKLFHKVSQRPGKPMWVGKRNDKMVFGLPGNPVSAYVCLRRYVIPALQRIQRVNEIKTTRVTLTETITMPASLTRFVPVRSNQSEEGHLCAIPNMINTSGDFFSLAETNGMVELPAGTTHFREGSEVNFYSWS